MIGTTRVPLGQNKDMVLNKKDQTSGRRIVSRWKEPQYTALFRIAATVGIVGPDIPQRVIKMAVDDLAKRLGVEAPKESASA